MSKFVTPPEKKQTADTVGKTENFATRHVMLITFVALIVVFIIGAVVFELNVYGNIGNSKKAVITQDQLVDIVNDNPTLRALKKYNGYFKSEKVTENGESVTYYYYTMTFDDYYVTAVSATKNGTIIKLVVTDTVINRQIDAMTEDLAVFFAGRK